MFLENQKLDFTFEVDIIFIYFINSNLISLFSI